MKGRGHLAPTDRLKGYDYSQEGAYFVTVCVKDHACLFGDVEQGEMNLNNAGNMVKTWWLSIPDKYKHVELDEYMVMPNHFHGIIKIVGADRCVCPDPYVCPNVCLYHNPYVPEHSNEIRKNGKHKNKGEHIGSPLPKIIQWFKTMTTNAYIKKVHEKLWPSFNGKLWQRNYYEHIIRDEKELLRSS
jgi:REP element-mobilizing transposase RayT